jgi:hypothetical protein
MAGYIDRAWIDREIAEFNRSPEKDLARLVDRIMAHGRFDTLRRKSLIRHLEVSSDDSGHIETNGREIWDLMTTGPRPVLKLSGEKRVLNIDRQTGETTPEEMVERMLSEDYPDDWNSRLESIEKFFNDNGVQCTLEHPGYLNCPTRLGDLAIGTVDGFWNANIMDSSGYDVNIPDELQDAFGQFRNMGLTEVTAENLLNSAKQVIAWANS